MNGWRLGMLSGIGACTGTPIRSYKPASIFIVRSWAEIKIDCDSNKNKIIQNRSRIRGTHRKITSRLFSLYQRQSLQDTIKQVGEEHPITIKKGIFKC